MSSLVLMTILYSDAVVIFFFFVVRLVCVVNDDKMSELLRLVYYILGI